MLAERDLNILNSVVDIYVREGDPVSSLRIKQSTGTSISTATIRSVMDRLERVGYLSKPHTSAGRIPTDSGYRFYVDSLESNRGFGDAFIKRLRNELPDQGDINSIMACASRILGGLSKQFAVVYGSVVQESTIDRIHLFDLGGTRVVVAVQLIPDYDRTAILRIDRHFDPDVISRAEVLINRTVAGKTLPQATDALDTMVRDNVTDEGIIARELASHREQIFTEPPAVELYFEEREHMLEQPELSDPKLLQLMLKLLQNKQYLTSILSERFGERTQVTIGNENRDEELQPFSLVTAGYRLGAARGVLGIIGPTRMRYDVVQELVGSAAKELVAIGEEFF
jgi:heat-inducible transcriptional repressor